MKPVPKRPRRGTEKHTWYLDEGNSLAAAIQYFRDKGFTPAEVSVSVNYGDYDESDEYFFCAEGPESDESFNTKVAQYERKMEAYQAWYDENRELIEEELERRRVLAEEKARKDEEKAKKRLQKAREKAAKELAKLDQKILEMIGS